MATFTDANVYAFYTKFIFTDIFTDISYLYPAGNKKQLSILQCYGSINPKSASSHYNDVIMGTMASQITSLIIWSLLTQPFIRVQIKENIKAPRQWPLCGEMTGDRWIPCTNGQ